MPVAEGLAFIMICMGAFLLCFSIIFNRHGVMGGAMKIIFVSAFYVFAIRNGQDIGETIMQSVVNYGLMAGGSAANPQAFLSSPDAIFTMGFARADEIFTMAGEACDGAYFGCLGNIQVWLPLQFAAWVIMAVFAAIGFMVLATAVLFKLALMAGVLLLPLAVFPPTAQFGFMPLSAVIRFSVQLFVLTLVTSVNNMVFGLLALGPDPGVAAVTPLLVGSMIFAGSVLGASRLASALVSGAMLSAGSLFAPAGAGAAAARNGSARRHAPARV